MRKTAMTNMVMRILISILTLAGLTVSALALHVHNMDPSTAPPCAVDAHWDCGIVNHSRFSYFPPKGFDEDTTATTTTHSIHIPVAVIGIAGYTLMFLCALFGRWWAVLQLAEIGFAAACFLTYLEAYVLQKWCIYCVWSQGIVTSIVLATIVALILRKPLGRRMEIPAPASERSL